jgi:hypothetical protein
MSGRTWARADGRSLAILDEAIAAGSLEEMQRLGGEFLNTVARDGEASFQIEVRRLALPEQLNLAAELACEEGDSITCIEQRYTQHATTELRDDLRLLMSFKDQLEASAWLIDLQDSVGPTIKRKGRTLRRAMTLPAFPAVYAWRKKHSAKEYEGPQFTEFSSYRVYLPDSTPTTSDSTALLAKFAPILIQETLPDADYDPAVDQIGSFRLTQTRNGAKPVVDVFHPVSYGYVDTLRLRGQEFPQLVYTFWYPEHAKSKAIDPGAGPIEGISLRISLDLEGRPRFFETIYNCGCSHRIFVDREIEELAATEFGSPEGDRPYSIQRDLAKRINFIVPELVDYRPGDPLLLFVRASFHMPASVRFGNARNLNLSEGISYQVRDYVELERLPHGATWASIFDDNGLVRGAHRRLESAMLTPLGLYRAGHPRQRGTQLIHFDQADFDDPDLFDTYLRLPSSLFISEEVQAQTTEDSSTRQVAGLKSRSRDQFSALKGPGL